MDNYEIINIEDNKIGITLFKVKKLINIRIKIFL